MRSVFWAALGAAFFMSIAGPAAAGSCFRRDAVVEHLRESFGERLVALGLASTGVLIEVFSAPDGTSWTIVVTHPNGISCPVADGERWQAVPTELPGEKS